MYKQDIQDMGISDLFIKFSKSIQALGGFWVAEYNSKARSNALECLHCLFDKGILDKWYPELIKGCDRAIASYQMCTGYAKQWKQLKQRLFDEAPDSVLFRLTAVDIHLECVPELLDYLGVVPDELREFTIKMCTEQNRPKLNLTKFLNIFPGWNVRQSKYKLLHIADCSKEIPAGMYRRIVSPKKEKI